MRRIVCALACWIFALAACTAEAPPRTGKPLFAILCYHDIAGGGGASPLAVAPEMLRNQIQGLKASGWTFLRLSEVLERRANKIDLPQRTIVLTFDDGYLSFHDKALPILLEENVPATLAVIDAFTDAPPAGMALMSWDQIRAAEATGLVEIASHSHDLHRWVTDNPFRDTFPSVGARRFLTELNRYEDRYEYRERIRQDMREAKDNLREKLGHEVTTYVWPYGEHNEMARALAAEAGFSVTLGLDNRPVGVEDLQAGLLPRVLVTHKTRLTEDLRWISPAVTEIRAAQLDIDPLYDADPVRLRNNVDALIVRLKDAGTTHVILQACPDLKGDGNFRQTWFMNHQIPIKADVWSAVAAKLHQAGLQVWLRGPVLNLSWVWKTHPDWRIPWDGKGVRRRDRPWYYRVSPDLPEARQAARDFYSDAAVYLPLDGILFDDDAYMLPNEALIRSGSTDPRAKSDAMREMISEIMRAVRAWRPLAKFGRNAYAAVAENAGNGVYSILAQDFDQFLEDYDLTVIMAYTQMENHRGDALPWLRQLVTKSLARWTRPGPAPVLFKLQAYDWAKRRWVEETDLMRQAIELRQAGAAHVGVYPVSPHDGSLPKGLLVNRSVSLVDARAASAPPGGSGAGSGAPPARR
jgi:poly-beta-1,6-N-acetyl-D-glucosamine N-deacetylase